MDKPKMLELFAGTKSIGKVFKTDYDVISLDYVEKFECTYCEDILEWDYKSLYKEGDFEVIWASPDCTSWSIASGGRHRTKADMSPKTEKGKLGERLIHKTLEIINYLKPKIWFIENPRGLLQYFPPMMDLPHKHLVYYGNYTNDGEKYAGIKPTHFWSNIFLWDNEKKPVLDESCYFIVDHTWVGNTCVDKPRKKYNQMWNKSNAKIRSIIPDELVKRVLNRVRVVLTE
jgi:hypothetical protein